MPSPVPLTLHDPSTERDACGIGFVADASGRRSRGVVDLLLAGLAGVEHRGAAAADATGDGAGVLLPLMSALVPAPGCGLAMLFLRGDHEEAVEAACRLEGIEPAGWRDVPVELDALGPHARATLPRVRQLALAAPRGIDAAEAESRAHRARRRAERTAGVYAVSFSFRTVTYKALCSASHLAEVYPDLRDPRLEASFGLFHQRFSTNTQPSWERAQPFRLLGHNGEINAIEGNARWMRAREGRLGAPDEELLAPALDETGSDSAMLDEALELLVRHGRDVRHALAMLVPEAPRPGQDEDLRAFYRYHAGLVEPWDGPAALVFSDGRVVGAALDRNGLRPLRFQIRGDLVVCASEAGAIPLEGAGATVRGRLGPGEMLAVEPGRGIQTNAELKSGLAGRHPYRAWLEERRVPLDAGEPLTPPPGPLTRAHALYGYTREELSLILRPLAGQGAEPVSSMGDDTALPPLAGRARPLASYFRQRFAQVTNPAIDHLRERSVMSLVTLLGRRAPLLAEEPAAAALSELPSFFLYPSGLARLGPHAKLDAVFSRREGLERACERLCDAAEAAVSAGAELLLLSDARAGAAQAPVPSLLAVAAVHARLVARGLRTACSIVVDSCEPRESHHFATLLGYGADAICPRLALETVAALAAADKLGGDRPDPAEAQRRFRTAVEDGVLKVMSKLGISDLSSYRGAQLFQAVGVGGELLARYFPGTPGGIGGIGLAELETEVLARLEQAEAEEAPQLENPGYVKFRKGGEQHQTSPEVLESLQESLLAAHALRSAVRYGRSKAYSRFSTLVHGRAPMELRDLLELVPAGPPLALAEVEPVDAIVRRFSGGAMSYGALSAEAHEVLAIALNRLGARSNCGEGGEDPARYRTERNSRIKQVASARFGVTPEYAVFADELQIKISQGSKPGEGGQIPAHKVTAEIARLRHTRPGVQLISPPPHHDIYSIEDLAQLIFDLRQVSPAAAISVKLVSESGVGLVAAGVAKALADVIHIAGADGGTGASPLTSIKNAGAPWELGLAETQQALVANGLRGRVRLRADGGFKTGRDVVVAALLGADEYSFGTALLLAEGCLMVRSCHLDTCPVGIASQRPELRAKFAGTPEMVEAYLLFVAGEARRLLASLGLRTLDEAVGRVECLRQRVTGDARADSLDLAALLGRAGPGVSRFAGQPVPRAPGGELGELLAAAAEPVLTETRLVEPAYPISTRDRAVGARLGGAIARVFGPRPPHGRVRARFEGSAGQSFGAFLAAGVELDLVGEANDYVGKAMSGGRIVIAPPAGDAGEPVLAGNTVLYGATGGELFVAGRAGERFAVRNSGATAVVEGVGDHACEYMTAGTVVVLGPHGANFGAGMTGGEALLLDADEALLNPEVGEVASLTGAAAASLHKLLERHVRATGSELAASLLADWDGAVRRFTSVQPAAAAAAPVEHEISA